MAATIFWVTVAWWLNEQRRRTRLIAASFIIIIVGFSRLVLGVHFLPDLLASLVFAGLYLAVIVWVFEDQPGYVFVVAICLSIAAVIVSGGESRALLALVGTISAPIGWRLIESQPAR